jgi:FKBP-type peptidyl-prolyl cis-trans isomerase
MLLLVHGTQALRVTRRALAGVAGAAIPATAANAVRPPEFVTQQPGFTPTKSGLQIKDVKEGTGAAAAAGDRVVYEWEGYTIGYFGRPFEKKAGLKGGDFEGEKDYSRFVVGKGEVVPALEEGVLGVREGGVRQIIFPPELGYPMVGDQRDGKMADPSHDRVGPKPTTFSGSRALDFVLTSKSDNVDKTLLLNFKVVRVDKPGGKYKF